jgi:hypothetical protein
MESIKEIQFQKIDLIEEKVKELNNLIKEAISLNIEVSETLKVENPLFEREFIDLQFKILD